MSDWELERGCAASLGFDDDRRMVADRILRDRYAGPERRVLCSARYPGHERKHGLQDHDRRLCVGDRGREVLKLILRVLGARELPFLPFAAL